MAKWFALGFVDLGLIPIWVKPMTLKFVFTASLLDAHHYRDCVKNKPASLLVVPLQKALSGISSCWCGRQMVTTPKSSYTALIAFL